MTYFERVIGHHFFTLSELFYSAFMGDCVDQTFTWSLFKYLLYFLCRCFNAVILSSSEPLWVLINTISSYILCSILKSLSLSSLDMEFSIWKEIILIYTCTSYLCCIINFFFVPTYQSVYLNRIQFKSFQLIGYLITILDDTHWKWHTSG